MESMKVQKIIGLIFGILGAVLLGVALFFFNETTQFMNKAHHAEGVVIEFSDFGNYAGPGKPVIRFETEEGLIIRFTSPVQSNPSPYKIEDSVEVLYLPEYPQDARINGIAEIWLFPIIFGSIGGPFFITGAVLILIFIMGRRKQKWLMENGSPMEAEIKDIQQVKAITMNSRHPYQILAEMVEPVTGERILCKSGLLWENPEPYLKEQNISRITVLVDPDNYKKNMIDTNFLQK